MSFQKILLASILCVPAFAQEMPKPTGLPFEQRMNGEMIINAFSELQPEFQKISAVVYSGRKNLGYGIVMSPDGFIFTKASEIKDQKDLFVRLDKTKYPDVSIVAVNENWDLALLKIKDAQGLETPKWDQTPPEMGSWVISNGATTRQERKLKVGVISALARPISPGGVPALGLEFDTPESLKIKKVLDKSGAQEAGIKVGDTVTFFLDSPVKAAKDLVPFLNKIKPGDIIPLKISRDGKEIELKCRISSRSELFKEEEQKSRNDEMSGDFSTRRSKFPMVLQHDTLLHPQEIGGPVVSIDGKVVGMNIARVNRSETFAIPAKNLLELFEKMKSSAPAEKK